MSPDAVSRPPGAASHRASAVQIAAATLLMGLPLAVRGLTAGHDARWHLKWSYYFSRYLASGDLYPRWIWELNEGLGSPVFYFYPPLAYYVTAPFHAVFTTQTGSAHALGISLLLSFGLGAAILYLWMDTVMERRAATAAAIAYVIAPYHSIVDAYWRAAVGEMWGFALLPLPFLGIARMRHSLRHGAVLTCLGVAGLTYAHPLSMLLAAPLLTGYAVYEGVRFNRLNTLVAACAGTVGLMLAAPFLSTALTQNGSLQVSWTGLSYALNFLFVNDASLTLATLRGHEHHAFLRFVELSNTAVFVVTLVLLGFTRISKNRPKRVPRLMGAASTCAFLMQLEISTPLWDALPLIAFLQFPWRFGVAQSLLLSLAAALAWDRLAVTRTAQVRLMAAMWIAALSTAACIVWFSTGPIGNTDAYIAEAFEVMQEPGEYVRPTDPAFHEPVETSYATAIAPDGHVTRVTPGPPEAVLDVSMIARSPIVLHQAYSPFWAASSSTGEQIDITDIGGLVAIHVPPGEHTIRVFQTLPSAHSSGLLMGLIGVVLLAWMAIRLKKR